MFTDKWIVRGTVFLGIFIYLFASVQLAVLLFIL